MEIDNPPPKKTGQDIWIFTPDGWVRHSNMRRWGLGLSGMDKSSYQTYADGIYLTDASGKSIRASVFYLEEE